MRIYADPITINSRKVIAGLKLMGIDYELNLVDYFQGQFKSPEYVSINPNASLPSLVDSNITLWESNAILQYAADKNGKSDYYPTELTIRADINRWLFWETSSWFPSCYVYMVENVVKPLLEDSPDESVLEAEGERFHKLAGILDKRLAENDWICGNSPTIADISMAAPMHMHELQKLPLSNYPNLTAWMTERLEKLDCWEDTYVGPGFKLGR